MSDMLDEPQAAARLGVSARTLQRWRLAGRPVPSHRTVARRVYYAAADVDRWLVEGFTPAVG